MRKYNERHKLHRLGANFGTDQDGRKAPKAVFKLP